MVTSATELFYPHYNGTLRIVISHQWRVVASAVYSVKLQQGNVKEIGKMW